MKSIKTRSGSSTRSRVILASLIVLIVGGSLAFGAFYYQRYQQLNKMTADQFSQRANTKLLAKIAKLYSSLPKDEQPSIATIKDKETVKKQYPFLSQAENDDTLLLYQKAQLAILYRPSTDQLVKVGALNIKDDQNSSTARIKVIGSAADRQTVTQKLTDSKLTYTEGDAKANYSDTVVVDLTGTNLAQAKTLADKVGGEVGSLPSGEDKPADVDLLVIAGSQN